MHRSNCTERIRVWSSSLQGFLLLLLINLHETTSFEKQNRNHEFPGPHVSLAPNLLLIQVSSPPPSKRQSTQKKTPPKLIKVQSACEDWFTNHTFSPVRRIRVSSELVFFKFWHPPPSNKRATPQEQCKKRDETRRDSEQSLDWVKNKNLAFYRGSEPMQCHQSSFGHGRRIQNEVLLVVTARLRVSGVCE